MKIETTISRRKLLARIPAVATIAVPVAATTLSGLPAESASHDTELLALGQELAPLVVEINALRAIDFDRMRKFNAKLAALGLKEESEYEDADAYNQERWRLCEVAEKEEDECDSCDLDFKGPNERLFALLDDILDIQPTTLEGFAVQVLAVITAYDDLCDDDPHSEPPDLPAFYRNMCRFLGVPLPESAA